MKCPTSGRPVEVCMCGERHFCPNCREVAVYDADDRDLRHCMCGGDEDETLIALVGEE